MLRHVGNRWFVVFLLAALSGANAADLPATNALPVAGTNDEVVARGKGIEVRRSQVDQGALRAYRQAAMHNHTPTRDQKIVVERQVLEQLINVQLLDALATDAEKAAGKAAAEKRYTTAVSETGSEEALLRQMNLMGVSRQELIEKWTEALTGEAVLKRELKIKISEDDVRRFYEQNPKTFDIPEKVRAAHILITTRDIQTGAQLPAEQKAAKFKEAEALLKRARSGEDFATLATKFTNDAGSRASGGEYTFARGQMTPEVENVAFQLNTNQISDIITSPDGYHIIKLIAKLPAHKVSLAQAEPEIESGMIREAIEKQFAEYIAKLRKDAGVEILDPKLKPEEAPTQAIAPPPGK